MSIASDGPDLSTIAAALSVAARMQVARLDAQLLLLHALGRGEAGRAWLIAHDEQPLSAAEQATFARLLEQRTQGVPVAYLTGRKEFFGLTLHITSDVLDPRDDTETLVEWALELLRERPAPRVLDLGTGSGAIALAIQSQRPDAQVWASDQSPAALAVARANGQRLGLDVQWLQGSWLEPVRAMWQSVQPSCRQSGQQTVQPSGQESVLEPGFDLVLSNPPYIAADDPHLPALRHEPTSALVSGADGLDDIRHIAAHVGAVLAPGGWLLLEHGWDQAAAVAAVLRDNGLKHIAHRHDLAGHVRCTGGCWEA